MLHNKVARSVRIGVGIVFLGLAIYVFLVPIGVFLLAEAIKPDISPVFAKTLAWIELCLGKTICS